MGRRRDEKKHGGENKIVKRGKVEEGVLTVEDYIAFILIFNRGRMGGGGGGVVTTHVGRQKKNRHVTTHAAL